jgi:hypothetical protein
MHKRKHFRQNFQSIKNHRLCVGVKSNAPDCIKIIAEYSSQGRKYGKEQKMKKHNLPFKVNQLPKNRYQQPTSKNRIAQSAQGIAP